MDEVAQQLAPARAGANDAIRAGDAARVGGWWGRSWRQLAGDAAVLFGLAGVAITQPMLDLFGKNPTFFVAGDYGRRQIVAFALVIGFVPTLVVFAVTALPGIASARAGRVLHGIGVGALAGLFGLLVARTVGIDALLPVALIGIMVGIGVALLEWRIRAARQFLSYMALGNLAFMGLFLGTSPTSELLAGTSYTDAGSVKIPPLGGPVLVVVLDEFPLTSLIGADGQIIEERYPNFAKLAESSTWFRNAASESKTTFVSVPSILTGVRATEDDLPFYRDHPRNYFTLFGSRYPISRYEIVTDLCPPDTCTPPPHQSLREALDDASIVYRHRVLPDELRDGLPDIDRSWGNFGDEVGGAPSAPETTVATTPSGSADPMARLDEVPASDAGKVGQASALRRQLQLIGADPSINFVHVLLPHHAYALSPWGPSNTDTWNPNMVPAHADDPGYDFIFRELYALQAMQIGAVDQMIGQLMEHLEATGAWDDTTLVVTSDHGIDITPPGFTRTQTPDNTDELFRIPLFIKAPGQTKGAIDDAPASTIDVVPSLVDLLGIEAEWTFDGHSLFDGSTPTTDRLVTGGIEAAQQVARRHTAQFPRGEGWDDLAAVGEGQDLVGRRVADVEVGAPSELEVGFDRADLLSNLSASSGEVPYSLRGSLRGADDTPPELVVALNGTFAGTIGGYRPDGDGWLFSGLMANYFVDGPNEVVAYEVERTAGDVTLHPVAQR
jgi:Sulfatase